MALLGFTEFYLVLPSYFSFYCLRVSAPFTFGSSGDQKEQKKKEQKRVLELSVSIDSEHDPIFLVFLVF